jgi:hypothetical protein
MDNTAKCVDSAYAVAIADFKARFSTSKVKAAEVYHKVRALKLDSKASYYVYEKVEDVTRQAGKGEKLIAEVEDILLRVGPSKRTDKSTAVALRSAKRKLISAILIRQKEADRAVQLCYKAIVRAQADTVRRAKVSGSRNTNQGRGGFTVGRENKTMLTSKLKCDQVKKPYEDGKTLEEASAIIYPLAGVPLISTVYKMKGKYCARDLESGKVTESEFKLASHSAVTMKTTEAIGTNRGMAKPCIRYEMVDDIVAVENGSNKKDGGAVQLLSEAIMDAGIDTDVSARTLTVPDSYSKLHVSFIGDYGPSDVLAMTAGAYSDSMTIMRHAVAIRQHEADAKIRCGRHMHAGLDEVWAAMRSVVKEEGLSNVVDALRWIQLTKWMAVQNNVCGNTTQVVIQSRIGCFMLKYGDSVAANIAEAISLTAPGVTYRTIKSVLSGLSVHTMSQAGVAISEVSVNIDALAAVNKIELITMRHVNGPAAIRWLRAYLLSTLQVRLQVTAGIEEVSHYRAACTLESNDAYVADVVVRLPSVPFDCASGDLLIKARIEEDSLIRKAHYGRRFIFDETVAMRVCAMPIRKIVHAIDEIPTKGVYSIPVAGTTFVGLKPPTRPARSSKREQYGGGGGSSYTNLDDYSGETNTGNNDKEYGGHWEDYDASLFNDLTDNP